MVRYSNGRHFGMIKARETSQPVYQQVRNFLVDEISSGRLSAGMYLPSERTICEHLSVSRDSIRRAIQELEIQGYISCGKNKRPVISGSTGNLFSQNANSIAFITGVPFTAIMDRESNQLANVFLHMLNRLDDKKMDPAFFGTNNLIFNKSTRIKNITAGNYGAIVYYPGGGYVDDEIISLLEDCPSPTVVIEGYMKNDNTNLNTVELDNFQGGYLATEYLIQKGHKNIVHLTFSEHYKWIEDRLTGYRQALLDNGLEFKAENVIELGFYDNAEIEKTRKNIKSALNKIPEGSGVFCINDEVAYWLTREADNTGKKIPEDYSVIGFDNIAKNGDKRPTTISHMTKELGMKAAEIILKKMNTANESFVYKEAIKPKLIIRESVKQR